MPPLLQAFYETLLPEITIIQRRTVESKLKMLGMFFCETGCKKSKGIPYSITERRVPELIPVLGSQVAGDVSHKPGGWLPLLSTRPAVTPATLRGLLPILLLGEQRHNG